MRIRDVSSDVWSSDLADGRARRTGARDGPAHLPARPCGAGRRRRPYRAELCGNDPEGKPDVTSVLAAYDALVAAGEPKADLEQRTAARSEERRVGKECVSTCRTRCSPDHKKKN